MSTKSILDNIDRTHWPGSGSILFYL